MLKKFALVLVALMCLDMGVVDSAQAQEENSWIRRTLHLQKWRQRRAEMRERVVLEERRREAEVRGGPTRVYGYTRRLAEERDHCTHVETHATSVLSDTENAAMNSAKLNWGAMVRAEMGERYMDIEMAVEIRHRCYRASTNETLLGKAAESLTGAFQWRCEIKARACRPGWQFEHRAERR